jgi:hypothetical protein
LTGIEQSVASMWQWVVVAVPTPLGGVVIGALATLIGGFGGSLALGRIEARREERRQARAHAAAVRAVIAEMMGNIAFIRGCVQAGSMQKLGVSHEAYTAVLLPLFSGRLPDSTASELAAAYSHLVRLERCEANARWEVMLEAHEPCEKAGTSLLDYALSTLKLRFY